MPACELSEREASINITRHEIQVGHQTVYYQVVGQGEPIILVHGLSGSSRWWVRNIPALAEHYRLYLLDLPGFGTMRRYRQRLALELMKIRIVRLRLDQGVDLRHRDRQAGNTLTHSPTFQALLPSDGYTNFSAIFYHNDEQRRIAEETIRDLQAQELWPRPIVTDIRAAETFYAAEDYHQNYFRNNPGQGYCAFIVAPKVAKFRQKFSAELRHSGERDDDEQHHACDQHPRMPRHASQHGFIAAPQKSLQSRGLDLRED